MSQNLVSWELWSYDVWGNDEDGYTVNDRDHFSDIEMVKEPTNRQVRNALIRNGFLRDTVKTSELEFDGDDTIIYVNDASDGYPLCEIILID